MRSNYTDAAASIGGTIHVIDLKKVNTQVDDMSYCVGAMGHIEAMFKAILQAAKAGDNRQVMGLAQAAITLTEMECNHLDSSLEELKTLINPIQPVH